MRFEITVMRAESENSPLVMMDRCTLEADSTADAARTYAGLFTAHGMTRYAIGEQPYNDGNPDYAGTGEPEGTCNCSEPKGTAPGQQCRNCGYTLVPGQWRVS